MEAIVRIRLDAWDKPSTRTLDGKREPTKKCINIGSLQRAETNNIHKKTKVDINFSSQIPELD